VRKATEGFGGDEKTGANIVIKALESPIRQIAENAGFDGSIVFNKIKESAANTGFNALTEEYVNMIEAGIIDPTKVVRSALQHSTSVASSLLTTEAIVTDIKEEAPPAMPGGGMGMM